MPAIKYNGILTAGQVAWICYVSPRTVCKWFGQGKFDGAYKVQGHRRFPVDGVVRFLINNKMPRDRLPVSKIYSLGLSDQEAKNIRAEKMQSVFHLAASIADAIPRAVVVDLSYCGARSQALQLCRDLRKQYRTLVVIGIAAEDESDMRSLADAGFNRVLCRPLGPFAIVEAVEKVDAAAKVPYHRVKNGVLCDAPYEKQ